MAAIEQLLGSGAFFSGGFDTLTQNGNPVAALFMLYILMSGVIVASSFIITRILKCVL